VIEKAEKVVVPAATQPVAGDATKPVAQQILEAQKRKRKWADLKEYEQVELLRSVVYNQQKEVNELKAQLAQMRYTFECHQHSTNGNVVMPLNVPMPGQLAGALAQGDPLE
jgi:hypothetical protein